MKLEEVLFKYFNYKSFRYPQKEIIEQILNKKDTLTIIPTGFGKSLIYQIPGLILDGITLVVTPLISLMVDQVRELKERGIKACYINSNLDNFYIKEIYKNIDKYKFIFVSAEIACVRLKESKFSILEIELSSENVSVADDGAESPVIEIVSGVVSPTFVTSREVKFIAQVSD